MNKVISTLAIVMVNWDAEKKDYIQNFVPFIVALIKKKRYSIIEIDKVRNDFQDEFGLVIPFHPMITLLERVRKQGYIKKNEQGKYAPIYEKLNDNDFYEVAFEQERKYSNILKKFMKYCEEKGEIIPEEQADAIIVSFFKEHDLDILFAHLGENQTVFPKLKTVEANNTFVKSYLVNSFFLNSYENDPETFRFIVDLSIGHLMASTLLYAQDYQKFQGRLNGNYYLDTGLLFNIIGINGEDKKLAYEEFIKLLENNGAKVFVFRHTYEEFIGILETCLNWVESPNIDPARASRSLMYFIDNDFTSSDVERFILKVGDVLETLKITIVSSPDPNVDTIYQIDENTLEDMIINTYRESARSFDKEEKEYTIQQDIKSLAAIYKLRRGEKPLKISDVRHLFVTTNATLAFISRNFEINQSSDETFFFIPTCLTDVFIGTLVWVNSPTKVLEISQKRLIATCYAALQPSRTLLRKYVDEIEKLKEQGEIREEEAIVLRVSRTARNLLIEETMGDPDRFTARTAKEILGEIKNEIRKEEEEKLSIERKRFSDEEERLKTKQEDLENELSRKDQDLTNVRKERERLETRIDRISNSIATWISRIFFVISFCLVIILVVFQTMPEKIPVTPIVKILLLLIVIAFGSISAITGFNLLGASIWLRKKVKIRIEHYFKS